MTSPVLPSEFLVKSLDDAIEIIRECKWLTGRECVLWGVLTLESAEVYLDKQASRILMEAGQ